MIKFENTEVVGWKAAINEIRNPMNSWEKSDSGKIYWNGTWYTNDPVIRSYFTDYGINLMLGPNDLDLMKRLRNAGTDHRKFMRMITVYVDITAPLYWWEEFNTYKVGTATNPCSTMYKIADKEFTLEDFSCEHLLFNWSGETINPTIIYPCTPMQHLNQIIACLNVCRKKYIETKDKKYWWQIVQLLPRSYNQKRIVMINYEVLANIYKSCKSYKLDEWAPNGGWSFCDWIKTLPYSELITGDFKEE